MMLRAAVALGQAALLAVQGIVAFLTGYLLLLTGAARRAARRTAPRPTPPSTRFAVLIPAHNEAQLLPDLLATLTAQEYPSALFDVHVVADNCSDNTAAVARMGGAIVHERFNDAERGKPYALRWLLARVWDSAESYDAMLICDADTIVSPTFLRIMDARLSRGERVIQSYYAVRDPGRSPNVSLRYMALAVLHYLRPQGRMVLGGSAGLKGNGMVFTTDILRRFQWSNSVTEDIDYHMQLILADERVFFAPDAVVSAEMPDTAADAASQNERWEQGRLDMLRRYVPALLRRAAQKWRQGDRRRAFLLFDATMEHLIPPFSILTAATGLSFVTATLAFLLDRRRLTKVNVVLGLGNTLGQIVYLLAGLRLAGAPRAVYKALLSAPFFIVWKIALYLRIVRRPEQPNAWVRTARNDPAHTPAQEPVWPANAPR